MSGPSTFIGRFVTEQRSSIKGTAQKPPSDLEQALQEVASLQAQLDTLRQELVWSNRLTTLGTMAAVLAHEYNNLLTPIGSYAQMALAEPGDNELTLKALQVAVDGVEKANKLAGATLDFARPKEAGEPMRCRIHTAVEHSLACTSAGQHHNGIQIDIDIPDVIVAMRELELQQVLVNLIQNARKAMAGNRGPRRLVLVGRIVESALVFEVRDSGPGIPDEVFKRVFEPFVTQPAGSDDTPGTGLGLRVCKDLVEGVGGTISAESVAGKGATFTVTLPIAKER
ncbi:MAG: sensor histidine kinase [Phycisphaeraceae bacterium]